jgi:hypothetical protein
MFSKAICENALYLALANDKKKTFSAEKGLFLGI